jgi:hypothetical protein
MSTSRTMETPKRGRQYDSELEKRLMVQNFRAAVEIYGKDRLRKQFKSRKKAPSQTITH